MGQFVLKPFVTIRIVNNKILINHKNGLLVYDLNNLDMEILKKLKSEGVSKDMLNKLSFHRDLIAANYLESKNVVRRLLRSDMFLECIDIDPIPEEKYGRKILVFGGGGGGGTLVYLLAQQGFSNIYCVDHDIVENSDVQKTMVYRNEHIGLQKTIALARIVKDNFKIEVIPICEQIKSAEQLEGIIHMVDPKLVIYAIDPEPSYKLYINEICFKRKIPLIFLAYSFNQLIVGPFLIPNKTSCYNSLYNYIKQISGGLNDFKIIKKLFNEKTIHPSISFNINILSSLILKDIIFFMADKLDLVQTLNNVIFYDILSLEGEILELNCTDDCEICHHE